LADGETLREFQKGLEPKLRAAGWWGKQMMTDPLTGQERPVQLGSPRRLETIFRTNMTVAYSAAHYTDMVDSADTYPYWQFVCVMDSATRPSHAALNGKIFRWDDPIWNTHFPPLDWGCRCRVRKLTSAQVRAKGLKVEASSGSMSWDERLVSERSGEVAKVAVYEDPGTGAKVSTGAGWSYNPGQAWHLDEMAWQTARQMPEEARYDFIGDMAKSKLSAEAFPGWVDGIIQRGKPVGFAMTVGWMKPELVEALTKHNLEPDNPFLVADDKGILHMTRDAKQKSGQALSLAQLKALPRVLQNYKAILYDTGKHNLLYVVKDGGNRSTKVVVEVNYKLRGQTGRVNFVNTASNIATHHLLEGKYILVDGAIK